jgi:hypothetical protein
LGKDVAFTDCSVAFLPGTGSGNPHRCSGTTISVAEAFSYQPVRRVPFPVTDWGRRFAAPGHGDVRDALRHGLFMYYVL